MRRRGSRPVLAKASGVKVECFVCAGEHFTYREIMMNTTWATFFGWDWLNRTATGLICCTCGYVMTFSGGTVTVAEVQPG
jgi:hypothetical protein